MIVTKNNKGSILVEALLTVVILSIGLTLIIQSMASALRAMAVTEDYASAMMILDNKMFEYLSGDRAYEAADNQGRLKHFNNSYDFLFKTKKLSPKAITEVQGEVTWGLGGKKKKLTLQTYLFEKADEKEPESENL